MKKKGAPTVDSSAYTVRLKRKLSDHILKEYGNIQDGIRYMISKEMKEKEDKIKLINNSNKTTNNIQPKQEEDLSRFSHDELIEKFGHHIKDGYENALIGNLELELIKKEYPDEKDIIIDKFSKINICRKSGDYEVEVLKTIYHGKYEIGTNLRFNRKLPVAEILYLTDDMIKESASVVF